MTSRPTAVAPQVIVLDYRTPLHPDYSSWIDGLGLPWKHVTACDRSWRPPPECALVLSRHHYHDPDAAVLDHLAREGKQGVLILADGILEYRNTWENPKVTPGVLFQPVVGHKLACLGRSQARIVESWGNTGKCEVVGAARFDRLLGRQPRRRGPGEPIRVLVMTAKNPGFTPAHIDACRRALAELARFFASRSERFAVEWRLADKVADAVGQSGALSDTTGRDLASVLQQVDAVITTPSTAMLEAMLHGLPVALLDYTSSPLYVPAAWVISCAEQIGPVLEQLAAPPEPKMLFQEAVLRDALECQTPAAPRMQELVRRMVQRVEECRARDEPVWFPSRMLEDGRDLVEPSERFDLGAAYPDHPLYSDPDRWRRLVELERLKGSIDLEVGRRIVWPIRAAAKFFPPLIRRRIGRLRRRIMGGIGRKRSSDT